MIDSLLDLITIKTSFYSTILFIAWFTVWYKTKLVTTEREIAYVCTLLSSFTTSLCSLPLVYILFISNDLSQVLVYRTWTVQITVFFMTFLFLDLVIGCAFYPSKIGLLTGWIHHTVYLGVLSWAIHQHYCSVFVMMCLLEIPTFLLALGSIRKSLRHDYLFAVMFVATRIVFHFYAMVCAWRMEPMGSVVNALSAFFPVHCYWFYGFIQQQIRLSKPSALSATVKEEEMTHLEVADKEQLCSNTIESCMDDLKAVLKQKRQKKERNFISFHSPPVSVH